MHQSLIATPTAAEQKKQMRNNCLSMALEYHRGIGRKNGYAFDIDALDHSNKVGKKIVGLTVEQNLKMFMDKGVISFRSFSKEGERIPTPVKELDPRPISMEDVFKTADKIYNYINKK